MQLKMVHCLLLLLFSRSCPPLHCPNGSQAWPWLEGCISFQLSSSKALDSNWTLCVALLVNPGTWTYTAKRLPLHAEAAVPPQPFVSTCQYISKSTCFCYKERMHVFPQSTLTLQRLSGLTVILGSKTFLEYSGSHTVNLLTAFGEYLSPVYYKQEPFPHLSAFPQYAVMFLLTSRNSKMC